MVKSQLLVTVVLKESEGSKICMQKIDSIIERLKKRNVYTFDLLENMGYDVSEINIEESGKDLEFFPLKAETLKQLRIACIMDRFSFNCYKPECSLLEITPENWKKEIEDFRPDILFIESAWEGKDRLWCKEIDGCSKKLYDLTFYCREKKIPIIFWNKEDPVYTDSFMSAAHLADYVFTVDIDCIEKYKSELKHDKVYHLHFAAQPEIHNPIEKYERKNKFCFAGAYYHRYKERTEVFDRFAEFFEQAEGLEIYDRNLKNARPEHKFPSRYKKNIIGNLDQKEIDIAYKGYKYNLNMNSIQQSQTMFARRAFELLASNTVTVGNYSKGLRNYFGDLTVCTDDVSTLGQSLKQYCSDEMICEKYRLSGLRRVLTEHLYEDRLDYIVQKVFGKSLKKLLPSITIFCEINSKEEMNNIFSTLKRQTYQNYKIIFICDEPIACDEYVISRNDAKHLLVEEVAKTDFIAALNTKDYYGENYFLDLVLTMRYGDFDAVGKATYYSLNEEKIEISGDGGSYKLIDKLSSCRSIVKLDLARGQNVLNILNNVWNSGNMLSIDIFNYCENHSGICDLVNDLRIPNNGIPVKYIYNQAEKIKNNSIIEGINNCYLSNSPILVLTNRYPERNNLYRNMFVHKRVMAYKDDGLLCNVMSMDLNFKEKFYEFEGIDIIEGNAQTLKRLLDSGEIKTVCVHFLDRVMWSVLKEYTDKIKIIIWLHGSEVQPWWRRKFNYINKKDLEKEKINSDVRMDFWKNVFSNADNKALHFVFVSQYFANEVMEDYKISLERSSYSVIHNFIDTELFEYHSKSPADRMKILSIKPYASRKYANDLTTKAIVELSKKDIFKEFEFFIYGDGDMFNSDNAPLKHFKNVHLRRSFLTQRQIIDLHKRCGIFIATTRWDSHGVSRDEAMSSGLIPITNAVSAIPEFVDENCGILIPDEDYIGVAEAIVKLYNDPERFLCLSQGAAKRVRKQSSKVQTILKEERLIKGEE